MTSDERHWTSQSVHQLQIKCWYWSKSIRVLEAKCSNPNPRSTMYFCETSSIVYPQWCCSVVCNNKLCKLSNLTQYIHNCVYKWTIIILMSFLPFLDLQNDRTVCYIDLCVRFCHLKSQWCQKINHSFWMLFDGQIGINCGSWFKWKISSWHEIKYMCQQEIVWVGLKLICSIPDGTSFKINHPHRTALSTLKFACWTRFWRVRWLYYIVHANGFKFQNVDWFLL